ISTPRHSRMPGSATAASPTTPDSARAATATATAMNHRRHPAITCTAAIRSSPGVLDVRRRTAISTHASKKRIATGPTSKRATDGRARPSDIAPTGTNSRGATAAGQARGPLLRTRAAAATTKSARTEPPVPTTMTYTATRPSQMTAMSRGDRRPWRLFGIQRCDKEVKRLVFGIRRGAIQAEGLSLAINGNADRQLTRVGVTATAQRGGGQAFAGHGGQPNRHKRGPCVYRLYGNVDGVAQPTAPGSKRTDRNAVCDELLGDLSRDGDTRASRHQQPRSILLMHHAKVHEQYVDPFLRPRPRARSRWLLQPCRASREHVIMLRDDLHEHHALAVPERL